jgi:tetratricopeptide (TPR) repeat protein
MIEEASAKFSQGMQLLQAKNFAGAVEAFTEAVTAFPQLEPAFRLRSEAYRSLGQDKAAEADLEAVISINTRAASRGGTTTWASNGSACPRGPAQRSADGTEPRGSAQRCAEGTGPSDSAWRNAGGTERRGSSSASRRGAASKPASVPHNSHPGGRHHRVDSRRGRSDVIRRITICHHPCWTRRPP